MIERKGINTTLPDERYRAVKYAREFMRDLLDPKKTPKVPLDVRRRARSVLRHFPGDFDMDQAAKKAKDIFKKDGEDQ